MSHVARNYVYEVRMPEKKPIPKVTEAQLEEYRKNIAKYLTEEKERNSHTLKEDTWGQIFTC